MEISVSSNSENFRFQKKLKEFKEAMEEGLITHG